jgi:hypothetical protein
MALNDIIVPKEGASGILTEIALAPADIGAVATSRTISSGTGLTGGGDLTANRTLAVSYGTTAGTAAQGNDSRFVTASTTTPAALGTAAVGTGTTFARADHVHAMPSAAQVGAAQAVTDIELTPNGTTTITTAQLPARGIAFTDGAMNFTVNLPTPNIRQSGLTFSIKRELEDAGGEVFITVVHNSVDLLTGYELDVAEGSIDFLWDGYEWTYDSFYYLRSKGSRRLILPSSSGTLALTEQRDDSFRILGSVDQTKKVAFEVDGLTTATTRTLTVPNASGTLALINHTIAVGFVLN